VKVTPSTKATPLSTLVDDYLAACRARGLSPKTVKESYGYSLRGVLLPWAEREGISEPADLTDKALNRLSNELQDAGGTRGALAPASVHTYMRGINHLLNWAREQGDEVTGRAQLPRLPKRLPDILSRDEIQTMEDAAATERDKLIIRLLGDTGVRVGELVALRPRDLTERDRKFFIKVQGKGSKDRYVPVSPWVYRRLERFATKGRPKGAADRLFLGLRRDRRSKDYEPLTTSGAAQLLRTAAEFAGIEKRVYPHLLRHSFASWFLAKGGNPILLAQILGHSSLTMILTTYSHLSPRGRLRRHAQDAHGGRGVAPPVDWPLAGGIRPHI
jgi:integrase/recombinase XerD